MSADDFLDLVCRSGLVERDRLSSAVASLRDSRSTPSAERVAGFLVEAGMLTRWQADRLLEGKWKGFFLGRYKLLGHLGTGRTSSVYLAEDAQLRRMVAVRVLAHTRADCLGDFLDEARAAAWLRHPSIPALLEVAEYEGAWVSVTEYVAGRDLATIVAEDGPLPVSRAVDYIAQAAKALEHAHAMGIVHGSMAPSKLILSDSALVMIVGFGRPSRELLERMTGLQGGRDGVGARGAAEDDYQADIFALGCTLFWVLCGGPPSISTLIGKRGLRDSRADAPEALETVFRKMATARADEGYQSMREVIQGLRSVC